MMAGWRGLSGNLDILRPETWDVASRGKRGQTRLAMAKWYGLLLVLQILVSAVVVFVFRLVESRFSAGMIAGSLFVLLGVAVVSAGFAGKIRRSSGTFLLGCVHLFGVALPMIATRALQAGAEFSQVYVLGMPGPVFHKLSTRLYLLMMVVTLVEAVLTWRKARVGAE